MEVKLKAGDSLNIPEGCKAVIKDNVVVFEEEKEEEKEENKEENKEEFKRGDVIVSKMNEILLVDRHSFDGRILRSFVNIKEDGFFCKSPYSQWNELHDWRLATEEEKQLLFDKMKEQGLKWNNEEKQVEKIRWRAKEGEYYFVLGRKTFEVYCHTERFDEIDAKLYNCGNYFRTQEQTAEAARRVREVLRQYHDEIGE